MEVEMELLTAWLQRNDSKYLVAATRQLFQPALQGCLRLYFKLTRMFGPLHLCVLLYPKVSVFVIDTNIKLQCRKLQCY